MDTDREELESRALSAIRASEYYELLDLAESLSTKQLEQVIENRKLPVSEEPVDPTRVLRKHHPQGGGDPSP